MSQNRFVRHGTAQHPEPRFGRLILISLALHLIVVALSFFDILPHTQPPRKQTYYVDLVNMPVKSPQAGRPDAATKTEKSPEPAAKEKPKAVEKQEPAVKKKPVQRKPPEKETVRKKAPPEPAVAEKPEPKPDRYGETLSAIEKMQQERRRQDEIEALEKKISDLSDTRQSASVRSELGMPEGTGTEAGPSYEASLRKYLKKNWSLSEYQLSSLDLEAKVELTYDAQGNLLDYRFVEKSGETLFDDSLKKAIFAADPLPFEPEERWEVTVTFNLKDLRD